MTQEMVEFWDGRWQWHQLDNMQTICTSLQTDKHTNTSLLNFYRPYALHDTHTHTHPFNHPCAFSDLTLLVGQQEGHPACKNWQVTCWHGYLLEARCTLAYGPANAGATYCLLLQQKSRLVLPFWKQHTDPHTHTHTRTHTHTHPFNDPFSGPTQVSRYQKGKANLDFTEVRDCDWQWHPLGHMQVCTSLQSDNHASNPPISFFTGRMPFLPPNQQRQSTEGTKQHTDLGYKLYEMVLIGGGLGGKQCLLSLVVLQLFLQPDKLTTSLLLYHQSMHWHQRWPQTELVNCQLSGSCIWSKIHIGFTFLVQAYLGSPGQKVIKRVCVGELDRR